MLSCPKTRRSKHAQDTPHQQLSVPHHLLQLIDERGFTQEPDTVATRRAKCGIIIHSCYDLARSAQILRGENGR